MESIRAENEGGDWGERFWNSFGMILGGFGRVGKVLEGFGRFWEGLGRFGKVWERFGKV